MSSAWEARSSVFLSHTHRNRSRLDPSHTPSSDVRTVNTSTRAGAGGLPDHRLHPLLWGAEPGSLSQHAVSQLSSASENTFPLLFMCFLGFQTPGYFEGNIVHMFLIYLH